MKKPAHVIEIYLQPGEWWFGDQDTRIRTVLGSCVSLVVWHPQRLIGGMCHYMLPNRARPEPTGRLDGRYADEAVQLLLQEIGKIGTRPQEYQAKLFGGGSMFGDRYCEGKSCWHGNVPDRNVEAGRALVARHGFKLTAEHLGGRGHRQVVFDIWNGHAWLKHTPLAAETRCPVEKAS